ncbi:MAG TPA: STAS/SEC14 domain-containing protein [Solirubrobacterales bacterium]|nr:STAS/SEC14 domain-containing protein [Solirubrobacterales bacterium]
MIERLADAPAGVSAFRASGEVSADDYRQVLESDLGAAAEAGEIRLLYVLDSDFSMTAGAYLQDTKLGLGIGYAHHSAWKRTAIVTDLDWLRRSLHAFAWMVPGELRVFAIDELEEAKAWVAG